MDGKQIYREYPQLWVGYGGVQGRLKAVSAGGDGKRRYLVAEQLTDRVVECVVPEELAATADAAADGQRRVEMCGKVYRNADGDSERVEVSRISVMADADELLSLDELAGSLPDITGGRSVEEHLRILRSEGYDDYPEPDDD